MPNPNDLVYEDRHESTRQLIRFFKWEHLRPPLRQFSYECFVLADAMVCRLPDSPELTVGLRKLLEAKDCFVRATLAEEEKRNG